MFKFVRLIGVGITAAALTCSAVASTAQEFPTKPVKIIVPNPPGGASDIIARVMAERLQQKWHQPVVVENRPGASTIIGSDFVAKAAPDGYTLLQMTLTHSLNATLQKKLPYDSVKDFVGVARTNLSPMVLAAHANQPFNTVAELIAYAKANPGKLNYASAGIGTAQHLLAEMFKNMAGVDIVHVPYRGSTAAHPDLMSGQVSIMFDTIPAIRSHVGDGRIKAIAVAGAEHSSMLPGVPTVAEGGLAGFAAGSWGGLLAPAKTPEAVLKKLNTDINAVLAEPAVQERLAAQGIVIATGTPEDFEHFVQSETARWAAVIRQSNIVVD
jgi:tripartite-type tricarboxylate transporter receptor subunit TctC